MKRQGKLLHEDWEKYIGTNVVFQPDCLTPEDITEANRKAYRQVHLDPAFMARHFFGLMKSRHFALAKEMFSAFYYSFKGS